MVITTVTLRLQNHYGREDSVRHSGDAELYRDDLKLLHYLIGIL